MGKYGECFRVGSSCSDWSPKGCDRVLRQEIGSWNSFGGCLGRRGKVAANKFLRMPMAQDPKLKKPLMDASCQNMALLRCTRLADFAQTRSANGLLQSGDKYTVGGLERKYCWELRIEHNNGYLKTYNQLVNRIPCGTILLCSRRIYWRIKTWTLTDILPACPRVERGPKCFILPCFILQYPTVSYIIIQDGMSRHMSRYAGNVRKCDASHASLHLYSVSVIHNAPPAKLAWCMRLRNAIYCTQGCRNGGKDS